MIETTINWRLCPDKIETNRPKLYKKNKNKHIPPEFGARVACFHSVKPPQEQVNKTDLE